MRMNVSAWAIRSPIPSLVLFMVLLTLGLTTFAAMPVKRFPNVDIPVIQVQITQPGASPSELETQVTKEVEDAVAGVNGIKHIVSNVVEGASTTTIEFVLGVPIDRATNDVKDAIDRIRADLPSAIDEPIVQRVDLAGLPILVYGVRAPAMTPEELSWLVDDTFIRSLQNIEGVGDVTRSGGVTREIRVALDADKLTALGMTAGEVNRQLRATNVDIAGGRAEMAGQRQAIRTLAGRTSIEGLKNTKIALGDGRNVRLDDLATVTDSFEEPEFFAELDGKPAVAFSIVRSKGASEIDVQRRVEAEVDRLRAAYPDVQISEIDTTVAYTEGVYHSTLKTLVEGAVLAVLVVFVFLRDLRATVIAAIALPLSIIPTFWAMSVFGFSLNLVSLLAITIVTGILVDDAIVEIENIVRHIKMGKPPYRASLEAADEIGLAVIAITTTIIAVFVPVSFMDGIAGQYFKEFGLTVAAAVFFSLLVARLITPLLAAFFMRDIPHEETEGRLLRAYTSLVAWSVRHRIATVILGLFVFAGSIASMQLLPSGFLPPEDTGRMMIAVELPPGSTLDETRAVTRDITARLETRPEVSRVFVNGGQVLGSGNEVRKATLIVTLTPKDARTLGIEAMKREIAELLRGVPDIRFWFFEENGQRLFQMVLIGDDGAAVNRAAAKITQQMRSLDELILPNSSAGLERPELRITPRTELAAELGITTAEIADAIRIATIGDVGPALARFSAGDRQIPIRVQLKTTAREALGVLKTLSVRTQGGAAVPLVTVADFDMAEGPTTIDRYDRQRQVTLGADLAKGVALGDALKAVENLPAAKALGPGLTLKQFGDAEVMSEVFENFGKAMGTGLMMVFAVLVLLFSSFLQPITILFSLPLSIGGAIIALAITQYAISLPVVIGILMLMGVVTKNAIMLVDFANTEIARGVERGQAIVDAGRKRARPIVMTTIAMCGGMLPSALALDSGGEFRAPMAVAVIGGLISSTVLTLVFVPAVYVLMDDIGNAAWRFFSRFIGARDTGDGTPAPATPSAAE